MDSRTEVRQFLASGRARISPEQAGLPVFGGNRRVPGLRREEVALLTGVSDGPAGRSPRLSLVVYSAEPGSAADEALGL